MTRLHRLFLALAMLAPPAWAEPLPPATAPSVAMIEVGVFCALQPMDQMPAPSTASGWIHVVAQDIAFHWPGQ